MYGKRLMLLVALATLAVGSLLDALTSNLALLIAGRAIQGASAAAIPLGISLLASLLPRHRVPAAIAVISAMLGVGGSLGLPLAGVVAEHADYHVLFWIIAAAATGSLAAVLLVVPESPSRVGGRVDLVGTAIAGAGLTALLLPLAQGESWGWTVPPTVGLFAGSAVLLLVFGWVELRRREPIVDLRASGRRPIVLTNTASMLFGFALFGSFIGTTTYVEAPAATGYGFGSSIVVGGLCLLPSGLVMLALAPVAARLIAARGASMTLAAGAVVVGVGWLLRIVAAGSLWEVIVGSTVVGAGTGIGYAAMPTLINRHTPPAEIAAANGLNSLARILGGAIATAIGGALLVASTVRVAGIELPSLNAYRVLFTLCAASSVLAALVAAAIGRGPAESG
jgi:MFS family permease